MKVYIKTGLGKEDVFIESSCPFEGADDLDCLRCYEANHGVESDTNYCWHYKVVMPVTEAANTGTAVAVRSHPPWILSMGERKWLEKQREYAREGDAVKARLEDIFFFCHRNGFKCRLVGVYMFVATMCDEWLIGYTGDTICLQHVNQRGKSTGCHLQTTSTDIRDVLDYIRRHDGSMYRRRGVVGLMINGLSQSRRETRGVKFICSN